MYYYTVIPAILSWFIFLREFELNFIFLRIYKVDKQVSGTKMAYGNTKRSLRGSVPLAMHSGLRAHEQYTRSNRGLPWFWGKKQDSGSDYCELN